MSSCSLLALPTMRDSYLAGVCLQLQVSSGCVLIKLVGNMFPQAQVELFITLVFQQLQLFITTLHMLIKATV